MIMAGSKKAGSKGDRSKGESRGEYSVFIPCAGIGSRLGDLTASTNKALVKINGKEIIAYIVEKFEEEVPIVVALGFKGELVRQFLQDNYRRRTFVFVTVDKYEGEGSGLGYSLYACKKELQCPFIFCANDTLVKEKIPPPDGDWIGHAERREMTQYRGVRIHDGRITELCEKGTRGKVWPYIGLSGIHDYKAFWQRIDPNDEKFIVVGESCALRKMIEDNIMIKPVQFTWYDTGNREELVKTMSSL